MVFRIRRIFFNTDPDTLTILHQIRQILQDRFPILDENDVDQVFERFRNPVKIGFQTLIFVADDAKSRLLGIAIVLLEPTLNFFFLDYLATSKHSEGRGIGGALYQRVQDEARAFNTAGIFLDCVTDDPTHYPDPKVLKWNKALLRFYEDHGAFPIIHNDYSLPLKSDWHPVFLLFDDLGTSKRYSNVFLQRIVKSLLDRRFGAWCPVQYIDRTVNSFQDDPFQLRPPVYLAKKPFKGGIVPITPLRSSERIPPKKPKLLVIASDQHTEVFSPLKGYFEVPVRTASIVIELKRQNFCSFLQPREYDPKILLRVHEHRYIEYLDRIGQAIKPKRHVFPVVFPRREVSHMPVEAIDQMGYYAFDTTTPMVHGIAQIAFRTVECTLTAADAIHAGHGVAYALGSLPGHLASPGQCGGNCYLNNVAVAAEYLSEYGTVAVLDIDYHHGSGTQTMFYHRADVFTISLHGNPDFEYPFFRGAADECGEGPGEGFNRNFPLPRQMDGPRYLGVLQQAIDLILTFQPQYLIVAFGLDIAKGDPTGSWALTVADFERLGRSIGVLPMPTVFVQEGGYDIKQIGNNATAFLKGLWEAHYTTR